MVRAAPRTAHKSHPRKHSLLTEAIFGLGSPEAYRSAIGSAAAVAATAAYGQAQPHSDHSTKSLHESVSAVDFEKPLASLDEALTEVREIYCDHAVWFHTPNYLAHLNCPVLLPALAAETLIASINSSVDTWDQSRSATLIEQRIIQETASWIGYGPNHDGVFTSGGSQSNLQALLLARGHSIEDLTGRRGLTNLDSPVLSRLKVFVCDHTHFSARKSAAILGLPHDAIVNVSSRSDGAMCADSLHDALVFAQSSGYHPMAVIATAGSTDRGLIDPIAEIAEVADKFNTWLHVDAAVGGILTASVEGKRRVTGIEMADSVTIDFHKTFFQPVSCSAIIVKEKSSLKHVALYAHYLNPESCHRPNQVTKSLQTTRRFDALKMWLTIRTVGISAVTAMFKKCENNALSAYEALIQHPDFEVLERPHLNTVLFRFASEEIPATMRSDVNRSIREHMLDCGAACIAATVINGKYWLKFTLLNPETKPDDIQDVIAMIAMIGESHYRAATSSKAGIHD